MEIQVRHAEESDVTAILAIVNHAILHTTANYHYEVQSLETQLAWFADKRDHGFPVIVATHDREVTGFASFGTFREKIGYQFTVEHSVYVDHRFTGMGIGKQLLARLIEIAKDGNYHVMIGGIDAENSGSIEFHRRFGFTECGTIRQAAFKFGRWLDLLFMQLILDLSRMRVRDGSGKRACPHAFEQPKGGDQRKPDAAS